ncbi:AAA family ATPase [Paenibacillus naphthalenovorans]|uniref:AAA family ATPase n=1 Tax=Paenibacillus naphthalenovorans TaxID=162209 RepID=UPI00088B823D|nr:AAA family ATPase [Paenibacillus naphthalenovorans]SDI50061.1 DNA transposition protein, AAA+ family ATPase [Paenibacillus naphthalenovorans]
MPEIFELNHKDIVTKMKQQLAELKGKYTVQQMSTAMGVSRSALSRFINEPDYTSKDIEEKVASFINSEMSPDDAPAAPADRPKAAFKTTIADMNFVPTNNVIQASAVLAGCLEYGDLGVIIGPAGSGKTRSVEEFMKQHPTRVVRIEGDDMMSTRDLIEEIGHEIGMGDDVKYGTVRDRVRKIVRRLKQDPVMIVVDEADRLVNYSVKKLEMLRTIHDQAKVGIVFVGLPKLGTYLQRGPSMRENLSQLYSRVGFIVNLGGLRREEVEQMLDGYQIDEDAKKELTRIALDKERGGCRALVKALRRSLDLAEGGVITLEIVQEAKRMLLLERARH